MSFRSARATERLPQKKKVRFLFMHTNSASIIPLGGELTNNFTVEMIILIEKSRQKEKKKERKSQAQWENRPKKKKNQLFKVILNYELSPLGLPDSLAQKTKCKRKNTKRLPHASRCLTITTCKI